ncbi:MAG: LamG-like jellyroll fold domain-containing protein [Planctomycetota bacterium]
MHYRLDRNELEVKGLFRVKAGFSVLIIFTIVLGFGISPRLSFADTIDIQEGLVAYWPFDEASGSVVYDESGNGNHGNIIGTPQWEDGVIGGALYFDKTYYIDIPNAGDFLFENQSVSFSCWIKLKDNADEVRKIITLGDDSNQLPSINLVKYDHGFEGKIYFEQYVDNASSSNKAFSNLKGEHFPLEKGIHLCGIFDWASMKVKLYIDGELQTSQPTLEAYDMANAGNLKLRIGGSCITPAHQFYYGTIDEVRIHGRALNEDEIHYLVGQANSLYVDDDNISGPWNGTEIEPFLFIQHGIDAAVSGATVWVKPGTYIENIDYSGKTIAVRSTDGCEVTIIDGNESGSVVSLVNGEGNEAVLEGFTIMNGTGTDNSDGRFCGGGIYCNNDSAPMIKNNCITGNDVDYDGAGIWCGFNDENEDTLQIIGNHIYANKCNAESTASWGGGITLSHYEKTALIQNNMIYNNICESNSAGGGIGIWLCTDVVLVNNTLYGNAVDDLGGGGLAMENSTVTSKNNIFWHNIAPSGKGHEFALLDNLAGTENVLNTSFSMVEGNLVAIYNEGGTINWGPPMVNAAVEPDPMFVDPDHPTDPDLHLTRGSPCINRGTNDGAPDDDIDGDLRPFMGTVDIGADEFTTGTHKLASDSFALSVATGGIVNFTLDEGVESAGCSYCLVGSFSGTLPGTELPMGLMLRVNWDFFNDLILFPMITTPIFENFLGELDAMGCGWARLNIPFALDPVLQGMTMQYTLTTYNPFSNVSNPVPLTFDA